MYGPEELVALLDNAHDKIVVIDVDGTYRYANAATERILGFDVDDLLGTVAFDYVHEEDRERIESAFEEVVSGPPGGNRTVEYRHRTADGEYVWLRSRVANLTDDRLDGYVVSSTDITEQRQAEADRAEIESRLRELAANTADVLWMFDADWSELLFVNDAFEDVWGMSVAELEADPTRFLEGVHRDDRDRVEAAMAELSQGTPVDIEYRVIDDDDVLRWVWVQGSPVYEGDEVVRVVGFVRDVTDRRRRQRHLRVMGRLLRHNLRNDLNVILGHVELLEQRGEAPTQATLDTIVETAESLLETAEKDRLIVDTLSDPREPAVVDVGDAVDHAVRAVSQEYPSADITVAVPEGTTAMAVPDLMVALEELLVNAVTHADGEANVSVTANKDANRVEVVVEDEGPPIPEDEYSAFVDGAGIDGLTHGSGLGLWLVHWIVDLSDGTVRVDPGEDGNRVIVSLRRPPERD